MKMHNINSISIRLVTMISAMLFALLLGAMPVQAANDVSGNDPGYYVSGGSGFGTAFLRTVHESGNEIITDIDRQDAYSYLITYKDNIKNSSVSGLAPEIAQKLEDTWYEANVYIANNSLTVARLISYVNEIASRMDNIASQKPTSYSNTQDFLFINNNSIVTSANYGEYTYLTLSLINLGKTDVTDVVITPQESTDINKWPFEITTASNALVIPKIQASSDIHTAHTLAQNATWVFLVSKQAKTGTYPLTFDVIYYRGGAAEKTTITTYIHINGAPGAGTLNESADKDDKVSTPRIIVTGFKTDPEVVYAGDTFNLTISVQNTSMTTAVSNIQFDLAAAKEGNNNETTYEAFLPTSGSATIFVPSITPGATTSISIEMTARSDLMQKPYVIALSAAYEDSEKNPYTMSSNISIPIKQEARIDSGEVEIVPESIEVGNQSNIMFPVYNKGKTTLYNVQVDFIGDSIEGGSTFLGKLEPGATGNVDAMVTGIAATTDDGIITARISYEDEAGNVSYIEKEITLFVMESYYPEDEFGYDDGFYIEDGFEEEQGGGGVFWKPIVITIIVLAVVGVIVWRVIARKRRNKKMLESFDEDDFE
ncbi:MAG: hypothetical protein KBG42_06880 [Lachnospiraceae bacterium]|nr:hypothetical protein [Lachnospiraceae bacterium]